ncbi:hypothetical protein [Herbiconiux sp. YIM B11900]|uniref:hypothetical protein n=1 Tax=Herbiconiux sp. YIM B11900 TaxID=3404131 RepID=UPI003F84990C
MATITPEFIEEQIGYLRTDHEFYIAYDEFHGDESDLPELRSQLRDAAKAAGMRVHTRVYEDDAVWVYDPDWNPTPEEREAIHREQAESAIARHRAVQETAPPASHLHALN